MAYCTFLVSFACLSDAPVCNNVCSRAVVANACLTKLNLSELKQPLLRRKRPIKMFQNKTGASCSSETWRCQVHLQTSRFDTLEDACVCPKVRKHYDLLQKGLLRPQSRLTYRGVQESFGRWQRCKCCARRAEALPRVLCPWSRFKIKTLLTLGLHSPRNGVLLGLPPLTSNDSDNRQRPDLHRRAE